MTSALLTQRWRGRRYVGGAKPVQQVRVRRVLLDRAYQAFHKLDGRGEDFGSISGGKFNGTPWQANLVPVEAWRTIPNVAQVELSDEFDENGVAAPETATIQIVNVNFAEVGGAVGVYHLVKRGYYAPWQGYHAPGRPGSQQAKNEWFDVLNGGIQVQVKQGYGADAMETTFTGLVDECDVADNPDELTLTGRNFGVALTDQRVFGWAKARDVPSPVVFCDRLKADEVEKVGYSAKASSSASGYPVGNIAKSGTDEIWVSGGHAGPNATEWCQIRVPAGRYETAYLHPRYPGMAAYCSIYARNGSKMDGEAIPDGWVDIGKGDVPGRPGVPFIRNWRALDTGGQAKAFLKSFDLGADSVICFSFRNLGYSPNFRDYRASVARLYGAKRKRLAESKKARWIMVDDPSDVVKWVLMWAGFKEWEVEPMGVRLKENLVFHQSDYLIDIINHMASQGGFGFHIEAPTDESSMGKPIFRRLKATDPPSGNMLEVRDQDLLNRVQAKFSKEGLSYIMRTRGKEVTKDAGGRVLGEDVSRRWMAVYYPPWSGAWHGIPAHEYDQTQNHPPAVGRLAGIYKHRIHTDSGLESVDECQMANLIIAMREALNAFTGNVEVPGYPGFQLDQQISMVDDPTGLNTRLWIGGRSSTFTAGEETEWKTTLTGSMLDTPDIQILTGDYQQLLAQVLAASE